ncbi:transcriptional regulator NanR [Escherichia coli]|uniref:Transcriptional regulator NanR n=1 Tax=Escherichia coli TaxID=562 RepID=A0A828HH08_ECOLX|nr:transcriptional regulator NanR [Escherichia coli]EER9146654.1 transcriptional regulator NanR [Escherichia coli]EEU2031560.1 transcriptional regulator NanR [Escherichia coli]EEU2051893.1 transcriptional regulator NanR [Escherichia coli]EEU4687232.1 transcriptional regulator NanR [Escherichia coli]EEV7677238.1 transcriptional regulator NanR [Escherichia coli]
MLDKRPLKRKKLSELVEEELEFMIRKGIFQEGEHIPSERTLMEMFKVGRPSVREALATLRRKGLIEVNNGERTKVCRPSPFTLINELSGIARDYLASKDGMQHFEQLRLFFELMLVRYASVYATQEQKNKLHQAIDICWKYVNDNVNFIRADINFHRILSEIPENPVFVAIHTALTDWLINTHSEECRNITCEQNITSVKQHEAICEAICKGDADKAETILKEHLLHSLSVT